MVEAITLHYHLFSPLPTPSALQYLIQCVTATQPNFFLIIYSNADDSLKKTSGKYVLHRGT